MSRQDDIEQDKLNIYGGGFELTAQTGDTTMDENNKPELILSGIDGNAFAILAKARRVAINNGMDWTAINSEATAGDYDHLLSVMDKYFEVA